MHRPSEPRRPRTDTRREALRTAGYLAVTRKSAPRTGRSEPGSDSTAVGGPCGQPCLHPPPGARDHRPHGWTPASCPPSHWERPRAIVRRKRSQIACPILSAEPVVPGCHRSAYCGHLKHAMLAPFSVKIPCSTIFDPVHHGRIDQEAAVPRVLRKDRKTRSIVGACSDRPWATGLRLSTTRLRSALPE